MHAYDHEIGYLIKENVNALKEKRSCEDNLVTTQDKIGFSVKLI